MNQVAETKKNEPKEPILVGKQGLVLRTLEDMYRFGQMVVRGGWAPKDTSPESVALSVQKGYEVGLEPLYAIQNIAVINGRPSIYGDAGLALVRRSGQLADIEEYIDESDPKNIVAVCKISRRGYSTHESRFSQQDAITAGLWGKPGPWKASPKRMLRWRALWFALRDQFGDVLAGMSCKEIEEAERVEVEVLESEIKRPTKARTVEDLKAQAKAEQEPSDDDAPWPGDELPGTEAPQTDRG